MMFEIKVKKIRNCLLICVVACGALAQATPIDGSYTVPVREEELVQSSGFGEHYSIRKRDGVITRIKYNIPVELTGEENLVKIDRQGDTDYFSGDEAYGNCNEEAGEFKCRLQYHKQELDFSADKAASAVRAKFIGNDAEIERRLRVGDRFRAEPAGVTAFSTGADAPK